jgi:hypothetical protein
MFKSSEMRWARHEAHMEKLQTKFYQKDLNEKDHTEDLVSDIRVILKWTLEKWDCRIWTGFIWFSTRTTDELLLLE